MLKHGFTMCSEDLLKTYFVLHKMARFYYSLTENMSFSYVCAEIELAAFKFYRV